MCPYSGPERGSETKSTIEALTSRRSACQRLEVKSAQASLRVAHLGLLGCLWLLLGFTACAEPGSQSVEAVAHEPSVRGDDIATSPVEENWSCALEHVDLTLDVATRRGEAVYQLKGSPTTCSWWVDGLSDVDAEPAAFEVRDGALHVRLEQGQTAVRVRFSFSLTDGLDGLMTKGGWVTWPTYCGRVFPCRRDPSQGIKWRVKFTGLPADQTYVQPAESDVATPMYAIGSVRGALTYRSLGKREQV